MNTSDIRAAAFRIAATLAVLCASSARAIRDSAVLAEGTDFTLVHCKSDHSTNLLNNAAFLFDGDPTNGVVMPNDGEYLVADFKVDTTKNLMYVKEISVGHGDAAREYSLYTSEDGSAWTAVNGAERVRTSGTTTYPVARRVKQVKYVAEKGTTVNTLGELQIKGFVSTFPDMVSSSDIASFHNPDGSVNGNWSGGGTGMGTFFNGNFGDGAYIGPNGRCQNGSYLLLTLADGDRSVFVTHIRTGSVSEHRYTLSISEDGESWTNVEDAVGVKFEGKLEFPVNLAGKFVKCVFDQVGGWTKSFAEIEVYAMDPDDTCDHANCTDWALDESASGCLEAPIDEKFCRACGSRFARKRYWALPIGHDFKSTCIRKGSCTARREYPNERRFGSGTILCSRGDFRLDLDRPVDLIATRVNGTKIGRVKVLGQVNFTDVSVTSTGNGVEEPDANWGVVPDDLIDDNWTWGWNGYWYARLLDDQHVDYVFGTAVDLTDIEISVENIPHTNLFFSVDDATGEETRLSRFRIERTDGESCNEWHFYRPDGEPPVPLVYDALEEYDELVVLRDEGIPAYRTNPDGTHPMHQKEVEGIKQWEDEEQTIPVLEPDGNGDNQYQRFRIRFFETPVSHLRIRQTMPPDVKMRISELHPWGTVVGAGDLHVRKETLLLLR